MVIHQDVVGAGLDGAVEGCRSDQSLEGPGARMADFVGLDDLAGYHSQRAHKQPSEHQRHGVGDRVEASCFLGDHRQ